jgi:hypothetical protein
MSPVVQLQESLEGCLSDEAVVVLVVLVVVVAVVVVGLGGVVMVRPCGGGCQSRVVVGSTSLSVVPSTR